jgi:hypothetical protein
MSEEHTFAFPTPAEATSGMSLRAYLAGQALPGLLAASVKAGSSEVAKLYREPDGGEIRFDRGSPASAIAKLAVELADAVITELAK